MDLNKIRKRLDELEAEIASLRKEISTEQTIPESKEFSPTDSTPSETPLKKRNWELFLGGNFLGKLGLLSILLASSWFIKYAFDNRWVNESVRVLVGLSTGFGVCLAGIQLARKKFRILPESVLGAGFSIVYLSLFGGYYYYDFFSLSETFLYLSLLSVFSSGLAYWIRKEILYIFALIGSILSPILISTGENSYRFLFGYLVFLNILLFLISRKTTWIVSSFFLLVANFVLYLFWAMNNMQQSGFLVPFLFINITYFLFVYGKGFLFPKLVQKNENSGGVFPRWNWIFYPIFLVLNSLCFGLMGYVQIEETYPKFGSHFILFGAVLFSLWILLSRKKSGFFYPSQLEIFETIHLYLLLGFTFVALLDFSEESWLTFSWIIFAGVVSFLSSKYGNTHLRYVSTGFWISALVKLYFFNPMDDVSRLFLLNERFALYLLSSLFLFGTYYIQKNGDFFRFHRGFIYMGIFTLILGTLMDVYHTVYDEHYRNLAYSYVFAFYSSVFLFIGFRYSFKSFRIAGIVIAIVLVGKLYFYDIWTMSMIVRIVAGFTLGVSFILVSLFYQKFREKLMDYQKTSGLLLLLLSAIFAFPLNAEEINTKGYRYYKEIRIPKLPDKAGNVGEEENVYYGKIKLDEDVVRHSGINDRRIVHNGRTIPFISRKVMGASDKGGEKKPSLLFQEKGESDMYTYVLKLPKIPTKTKYKSIVVKAPGEYEIKGKIYLGVNPENWRFDSEFTIYNYQEGNLADKIEFTATEDETYVRIEVDQNASNINLEFTKVIYESVPERMEFKKTVEKTDLESGFNSDTRSSVFYFRNPMKVPIHRAMLFIKEKKFERKLNVFFKNSSKEFERLGGGKIFRKSNGSSDTNLVFHKPISSELKIEIFDGDDDPLTLEKMEIFILQEEIIFPLNLEDDSDSIQNLRIYYGNPYAFYPEFDFEKTFSESVFQIGSVIQEERENENFGYSIGEPPVSTWIIRGFFFFGLMILFFLTYRVFRYRTSHLDGPVI
ncbi:DUF2339 domain-containing protein [Leptospira borgpetersenii]|uniref:DUF2339 domain-containing protein n=1 Tax=Leptospira borgpetersenii TaxID=174 RepID=UPI002020FA03|nr:DUF2339 domain-containing protein [Leptospira borgpetersenii]URD69431.1 DUF2339 domain-containing protein [Leptospira borgpetersenii]UVD72607.1 DUF2339 domain-containing protein [Leptospira borgpetersenii]UVD75799.1 DUF2339 domain-containing protein [Leptospira borgpetersenii]UZW32358.1 DUF2339 domain-containing protein [Leptospira borgpetersenii]